MRNLSKERNRNSIRVLQIGMLSLGLIILGRLYQLQIIDYETYSPLSRENSLRQQYVSPARGLVYDRYGNLLVENEPIYTITITPSAFDTNNIGKLAGLIDHPLDELRERVMEARRYSWLRPSRLLTEVDFEKFSLIEENIWQLPGISHQIESKRNYPMPVQASHILGYLREISESDLNRLDNYRLGDKIGKSGLEQIYENYLRGDRGVEYIKVNAFGQSLGPYKNGELDESPVKGRDLLTTIDTELQILAEELMANKIGAAVALDPDDGSVLAMVSAPTYNVRKLAGRIDTDYWAYVNADTTTPLYNRAISSKQPPGSTFKPLMALAGLRLGLITPETEVVCNGAYYKGRYYKCTASHGKQQLEEAIQNSCNTYFFSLMNQIASAGKLNEWQSLLNEFGIGKRNYIDLPNESTGILPDSSYLNRTFGEKKWGIGDVINLGVGQGLVSASPLQMALVAAQIANGGRWVQPHVVSGIRRGENALERTRPSQREIDWVDTTALNVVKRGMRRVVTDGSGRWYANLKEVTVAGKTGTAQNPHGMDHAWFIAFAPVEDPEIAVAVLVENAGFGSVSAAPIASLLIEQYITGEIKRKWVYDKMINFVPEPPDEEDE